MASGELYDSPNEPNHGVFSRFGAYIDGYLRRHNIIDFHDLDHEEVEGGRYRTDPDFEPEVILTQAFGADYDEHSYNKILAETAADARNYFDIDVPIIAQAEVAELLEESGEENVYRVGQVYDEEDEDRVISKHTTKEIMDLHFEEIVDQNLDPDSVLYVSHPGHTHRTMELGKNAGPDEDSGLYGSSFIPREVEWAPNDEQWQVRSERNWIVWEMGSRAHHNIRGWI